jgi:hypothetical protein
MYRARDALEVLRAAASAAHAAAHAIHSGTLGRRRLDKKREARALLADDVAAQRQKLSPLADSAAC